MNLIRKTRGWKLPVIAVIGVVFALNFVLSRPEAAPKTPVTPPPASSYAASIAGIGVIEPKSEIISIGVELPGVVRSVPVEVGETVKKGTPLFVLDERAVDAQIRTLEASLAASKIAASDAAAQYATLAALKDKRAVARDEINRRLHARDLAQARVRETQAQLEEARTTKARLSVKAPIDATVLEVNVRPGEFAQAGVLSEPLMRLGDLSTLHVRVEIDEENAARVVPESPAQAVLRGDTAQRLPLRFVRVEPYVAPKQNLAVSGQRVDTRVLQVIYAIAEDEQAIDRERLRVGQQLDVFIEAAAVPPTAQPEVPPEAAPME
jgi:HlyD family secretion protein